MTGSVVKWQDAVSEGSLVEIVAEACDPVDHGGQLRMVLLANRGIGRSDAHRATAVAARWFAVVRRRCGIVMEELAVRVRRADDG